MSSRFSFPFSRRGRAYRRPGSLLILAIALLLGLAAPSPAVAEIRIGYVDVARAAARSKSITRSVEQAESQLKEQQDELETHLRDLRSAQDDLRARRSVLTEAAVAAEEERIRGLREKVDLLRLQIDQGLRRTESEVMGPAVDRILATVNSVAREQGFDLVLRSDVVIYGVETLDITPLVIEALDRESQ